MSFESLPVGDLESKSRLRQLLLYLIRALFARRRGRLTFEPTFSAMNFLLSNFLQNEFRPFREDSQETLIVIVKYLCQCPTTAIDSAQKLVALLFLYYYTRTLHNTSIMKITSPLVGPLPTRPLYKCGRFA